MKDFIPEGTGNSRFLKSVSNFKQLYPNYDDFVAALVAGTLPIDFNGINDAGVRQKGSALSRANILPDETCDALGLDRETSEPKDGFIASAEIGARPNAYASDLFLYITGKHPLLNAGPYNDYWQYETMNNHLHEARTISLTGNAENITVYDGSTLAERM